MRRIRLFGGILLAVAVLIVAGSSILPWKIWLQERLIVSLEAAGLQNVQLEVDTMDAKGIALKNVSFGYQARLELQSITVGYSWLTLWHKSLADINLSGLTFHIRQNDAAWSVDGLPDNSHVAGTQNDIVLPVANSDVAALPFERLTLSQSALDIEAQAWQARLPLNIVVDRTDKPAIAVTGTGSEMHMKDIVIRAGDLALTATLKAEESRWQGPWIWKDIVVSGMNPAPPAFEGEGTLSIEKDQIDIQGKFDSTDHAYHAAFHEIYKLNSPKESSLVLSDLKMPLNGGLAQIARLAIPMGNEPVLNATLILDHISIDELMQQITGKRVTANGTLSGNLPFQLGPDNAVGFQQGRLTSDAPGTLSLQPDALPAGNDQLNILRDLLKNFHFTVLSLSVDGGPKTPLSAILQLQGANPDMYGGRAVKLNVNLGGDVLNLIRQNLILLNNPEKLIEQGKHAHP
jgi:hypothetical protein